MFVDGATYIKLQSKEVSIFEKNFIKSQIFVAFIFFSMKQLKKIIKVPALDCKIQITDGRVIKYLM